MLTCGHGGNIRDLAKATGRCESDLIDFSANINPMGPPNWMSSLIQSEVENLVHYPDPRASQLVASLADHYGVDTEEVLAGNGSTEILYMVPRIVGKQRAIVPVPSYVDYAKVSYLAGLSVVKVRLSEAQDFRVDFSLLESFLNGNELVFLGQPNNPTGFTFDPEVLRSLAGRHPDTVFVVDEAFADFIEGLDRLSSNHPSNVIVLCSHTKFYAIPGLRLGCAIADPSLASRIRDAIPPWSVNTLAQAVGQKAVQDLEFAAKTRKAVRALRHSLIQELDSIPELSVYPGEANFLLVRIEADKPDAEELARQMLTDGIAIRICTNFDGLDSRFFRIAVRTETENTRLCTSLRKALETLAR